LRRLCLLRKPDAFTYLENGYVHHHCSHNSCAGLEDKDWRALWEETTGEKYPWPNKGKLVEIKGFDARRKWVPILWGA
jgi:uncharacterized protein YgfB (UPF0149 family)